MQHGDITVYRGDVALRKTHCIQDATIVAVYTGDGRVLNIHGTVTNLGHIQWLLKNQEQFRLRIHDKETWITVKSAHVDLLTNEIRMSAECGRITSRL